MSISSHLYNTYFSALLEDFELLLCDIYAISVHNVESDNLSRLIQRCLHDTQCFDDAFEMNMHDSLPNARRSPIR